MLLSMELLAAILILSLANSWGVTATAISHKLFSTDIDVTKYGAVGDGKIDDSQAFLKAWTAACDQSTNNPKLIVPKGRNFLLKPIKFQGPCKSSSIIFQVDGNIVAPNSISAWAGHVETWLQFANVNGLTVTGNGQIDGQGSIWWQEANKFPQRPIALSFANCGKLQLSGLTHVNSPGAHISVMNADGSTISNLKIMAPGSSPNTDGIDISYSNNVQILGCQIATGDDCIAIGTESSSINITDVACGPGHGISIGSLGINGATSTVEQIHVKNCSFNGTTNGLRIKTWQGGHGYARKISYEDIRLNAVFNPITIDQYYCPGQQQQACPNKTSAVQVSDVSYTDVRGTSSSDDAISLKCSETVGCAGLVFNGIGITSAGPGKITKATCINAHGKHFLTDPTIDCLKP